MTKQVLLIIPSAIVARGLEQVFKDLGEFSVCGILSDVSSHLGSQLRSLSPDVVIIDPALFDFSSRAGARNRIAESCDAAVLAVNTSLFNDEETLRSFDGVIGLQDAPAAIIKKVRAALEGSTDSSCGEKEELSSREKEILVCVAKGMLNKEIADVYNISIHTVITHRKNITRKTGIKTVAGLTVYALLNNLIDINAVE